MSPELRRFCPSARKRAAKSTLGPSRTAAVSHGGRSSDPLAAPGRLKGNFATGAFGAVARDAGRLPRPGAKAVASSLGAERHARLSGPGGRRSKNESPRSSSLSLPFAHVPRERRRLRQKGISRFLLESSALAAALRVNMNLNSPDLSSLSFEPVHDRHEGRHPSRSGLAITAARADRHERRRVFLPDASTTRLGRANARQGQGNHRFWRRRTRKQTSLLFAYTIF